MKRFKSLLPSLTKVVAVSAAYIDLLDGDHAAAVFLAQCVYWQGIKGEGKYWYKTAAEWTQEIRISEKQARRITTMLVKKGILKTSRRKVAGTPKIHYLVNLDQLVQLLLGRYPEPDQRSDSEPDQRSDSEPDQRADTINIDYNREDSKEKILTPQQKMVKALSEVTHLDYKVGSNAGRLAKLGATLLDAGYQPELVTAIYGPDGIYWRNDWRGRKRQRPTTATITDSIKILADGFKPVEEPDAEATARELGLIQ